MSGIFDHQRRPWWEALLYRLRSALAVFVSLAVLVGVGWFVYSRAHQMWTDYVTVDDYVGPGGTEVEVTIPPNTTLREIADILVANDVIRSAKTFDKEVAAEPKATSIQAGRYRLLTQIAARQALDMLLDPDNLIVVKVTIPEGWRLSRQLERLAADEPTGTGIALTQFKAALDKPDQIGLPAYAKGDAEGFLFPETYNFGSDSSATDVLKKMAEQFTIVADDLELTDRAKKLDLTSREVVTIASIIENEVNQDRYRPQVARVILNRLEAGMPLQMDSTVHYVTGKDGSVFTSDEDRATDDPHNTYLYPGIPPGPIGAPGRASLDAILAPAKGDWIYFVTVNFDTGETLFATTLQEHNANVAKAQQWCADNPGRC